MITLKKLREKNPLVICITNDVVQNYTANGLVALGASPAMSIYKDDLVDLLKYASALLINIGTLTDAAVTRFNDACQIANEYGVPIILDPVAAGGSKYRLETCKYILENYNIDVVRGNASEIGALIGENIESKGVDSSAVSNIGDLALKANKVLKTAVVITGKIDAVCVDEKVNLLKNGSEMMPKVIGTGCLLGAVVGAFVGTDKENLLDTLSYCLSCYNIAGELAEKKENGHLPGTYQIEFLNSLYELSDEDVVKYKRVETYE